MRLTQLSDARRPVPSVSTPPPPPYMSVQPVPYGSMLPPPPPSFYGNPQQHQTIVQPQYYRPAPPASRPGTRVPNSVNTSVCSKCFLYFTPYDLRAHSLACGGLTAEQQPVQPQQASHPAAPQSSSGFAPSAPPPSTAVAGNEGRVVLYKVRCGVWMFLFWCWLSVLIWCFCSQGKHYWIPASVPQNP